jgi:hypothetical protein
VKEQAWRLVMLWKVLTRFGRCDDFPPGWKPRLYGSQDGRRYGADFKMHTFGISFPFCVSPRFAV